MSYALNVGEVAPSGTPSHLQGLMLPFILRPMLGQSISAYANGLTDIEAGLLVALLKDEGLGFWLDEVLPLLDKRLNPKNPRYVQGKGNIYERAKATATVEDIASRYTDMTASGPNRLRGCCPIHDERTPSFYVYLDSQRWYCYGACVGGGDVIELVRRLMVIGKWQR